MRKETFESRKRPKKNGAVRMKSINLGIFTKRIKKELSPILIMIPKGLTLDVRGQKFMKMHLESCLEVLWQGCLILHLEH